MICFVTYIFRPDGWETLHQLLRPEQSYKRTYIINRYVLVYCLRCAIKYVSSIYYRCTHLNPYRPPWPRTPRRILNIPLVLPRGHSRSSPYHGSATNPVGSRRAVTGHISRTDGPLFNHQLSTVPSATQRYRVVPTPTARLMGIPHYHPV